MKDFRRFIVEAKRRGLRVVTELVINHTSDQHDWFKRARRSDPNSSARNWYVWSDTDQKYAGTRIIFTDTETSNWAWDPVAQQFFWHRFFSHQPDLNFDNPDAIEAVKNVMRFWLRKGVDGFRVDVIWHLIKDAEFRDNPPNPYYHEGRPPHETILTQYSTDQPEVHEVVAEMRRVTEEFDSRVLIGEVYLKPGELAPYYGATADGLQLPTNFNLLWTPWRAAAIEDMVEAYEAALPKGALPNWVLGNPVHSLSLIHH